MLSRNPRKEMLQLCLRAPLRRISFVEESFFSAFAFYIFDYDLRLSIYSLAAVIKLSESDG